METYRVYRATGLNIPKAEWELMGEFTAPLGTPLWREADRFIIDANPNSRYGFYHLLRVKEDGTEVEISR